MARVIKGSEAAITEFQRLKGLTLLKMNEDDVGVLRRFAWLLPGPDRAELEKWVNVLVRKTKSGLVAQMMLEDGPQKKCETSKPLADNTASGASSSSKDGQGAIVLAANIAAANISKPPKKKAKASTSKESVKARMMAICSGAGAK